MNDHKTAKAIIGYIIMATSINYVMMTGELAGLIVTGIGYWLTRGVEMRAGK
jgi:hypothetical protein